MSASRVARHTFFNFLTIGFNAVSGLVVTAVIARHLAPEGMGTYSLVTWFMTVAGILVNLGLVTTTMKHMAEALGRNDNAEAGGILAFGVKQVLRNSLVVSGLWLLGAAGVDRVYHHPHLPAYMAVAVLSIAPAALMAVLTAACQALQRYGLVAWATGLYTGVLLVGSLVALMSGRGILGLLAVSAVASSAAALAYARFLHQWQPGWLRLGVAAERRKTLDAYSGTLMILIVLDAIVWQRSGVFFLGQWAPAGQVAFYALAFGLATMAMRMIPGTLVGLLIPSMSRSFGSGELAQVASIYRTAGRWMAVLALPVAVGGTVLAPHLVGALYGPAYAPVAPLLAVQLWAGALVMIFGFPASSVLYAVDGQRFLVRTGLVVGALNLVLAVILIPRFGAMGASVSTALSQVAALVPGSYFAGKLLGGVWPSVRRLPGTLAAAVAMAGPVWAIAQFVPGKWVLVAAVPAGAAVYMLTLWLFRGLDPEDWASVRGVLGRLPGLKRLPGLVPAPTTAQPLA